MKIFTFSVDLHSNKHENLHKLSYINKQLALIRPKSNYCTRWGCREGVKYNSRLRRNLWSRSPPCHLYLSLSRSNFNPGTNASNFPRKAGISWVSIFWTCLCILLAWVTSVDVLTMQPFTVIKVQKLELNNWKLELNENHAQYINELVSYCPSYGFPV